MVVVWPHGGGGVMKHGGDGVMKHGGGGVNMVVVV